MNGETFNVDPDFSVIFGCRSTLSLIGLTTGVVGFFLMERRFDNHGPSALQSTKETDNNETENSESSPYVKMNDPDKVVAQAFHHSGARDLVRVRTDDSKDKQYHPDQAAGTSVEMIQSVVAAQFYGTLEGVEAALAMAFPVPKVMLIGLLLWSLSFLLDPEIGGLRFYANFFNITCVLLTASIGPLLAFPMRKAFLERNYENKKKVTFVLFVISVLVASFSIADPEVDAPWYFNIVAGECNLKVFGRKKSCKFSLHRTVYLILLDPITTSFQSFDDAIVLFILTSPVVFMASRKMGSTWFFEGKPKTNSTILVQNIGPLLLIFGVFLLWVGTNAIFMADLNESYIPFWTTSIRGWLVFIAGMLLIVPGQLAMDLAFDQGSLPVTPGFRDLYVYKLNGNTFEVMARENITRFDIVWLARLLETPLLGSIGWFLMGLCSFMPFMTELSIQKFCTMFICFAVPLIRYGLVSPAFWRSDAKSFHKWLIVYYGLMVALVIAIGVAHGIALVLSLVGVGLILAGERKDMYDERKHGTLWLTAEPAINPNPQVYGLGQPLYIVGWIMLCTAMSVPM